MSDRKLVVLGIPWEIDTDGLRDYMTKFGELDDCIVMKERSTGRSRGFGYVTFATVEDAKNALSSEHFLGNRVLEVKVATPKEAMRAPSKKVTRIFVARVPPSVTEATFRSYFEKYGEITDLYMPKDPSTKGHRGIGFITFANAESVDDLIAETHELGGSTIVVDRATPKEDDFRPASRMSQGGYGAYNAYITSATRYAALGAPTMYDHPGAMYGRGEFTRGMGKKIFVGRLPQEASVEDLRQYFGRFGRILDVYIPKDPKRTGHRGFGFVTFADDGVADRVSRRSHEICARWYIKGYEAEFGQMNRSDGVEYLSPRDAAGHGTHTSSTAAGALVENASFMGLAQGLARGGAPSAYLAVYKVCWSTGGCSSADLLAAFDDAIIDGVDMLSVSIGSSPPLSSYVEDMLAIGSFHAVARGIPVVCSSGNSGPYSQTVINTAPWLITVAASTIDRAFPTVVTLGNNQTVVGQAIYRGKAVNKFYPIVYGEDIASTDADENDARSCEWGSLNETLARGKVVLCFESRSLRSAATVARTIQKMQGVGLIFSQFPARDVILSSGIPCVQVDFTLGTYLLTYIGITRNPVVKFSFTKTVVGQQISPEVAFFSSRGPSSLSPTVLKPDIAAPGVNILASWSPVSPSAPLDISQIHIHPLNFKIESGTSMACPHISGIVALIKSIHPTWSPAAIKSALITTASLHDEYGQSTVAEGAPHKQADPFDYGGGHVDANKAIDPGLIYDIGIKDYLQFLCSMGYNDTAISWMFNSHPPCLETKKFLANFNLPSITIPELRKKMTISRTVSNVGPVVSIYTARIQAPPGINVRVEPSVLSFNFTVKKLKFKVIFFPLLRVQGRYSFGYLFWEDEFHVVRIPLIVRSVIREFYALT